MPVAAKAVWEVTAGVLPGKPEEEWTKQWGYTSADYVKDEKAIEENEKYRTKRHLQVDTIFMQQRDAAFRYAKEIMHPTRINWVRVDFMWL